MIISLAVYAVLGFLVWVTTIGQMNRRPPNKFIWLLFGLFMTFGPIMLLLWTIRAYGKDLAHDLDANLQKALIP